MKKIIFILVTVLFSNFVFAEDVYNFYFQKSPGSNTVIQSSLGQTVNPASTQVQGPAPTTTAPVAVVGPTASETKSHWKFSVGHGHSIDSFVDVTGALVGIGYNFNKYFGLNASYLMKNNAMGIQWPTFGEPSLDTADIGLHVTPISLNAFDFDLFEISILGGLASIRQIEKQWDKDGYGYTGVASLHYKPYFGVGVEINFTKNFGLELFNKLQTEDINSEDNPISFNFSGASLAWRI